MTAKIELTQGNQQARTGTFKKLLWVTPLAMLVTSIANLILYFLVGTLFPAVTAWPGASPAQIIGANIVYLFVGAVVLAIINRISSQPAPTTAGVMNFEQISASLSDCLSMSSLLHHIVYTAPYCKLCRRKFNRVYNRFLIGRRQLKSEFIALDSAAHSRRNRVARAKQYTAPETLHLC